jgi:hypothetical protein
MDDQFTRAAAIAALIGSLGVLVGGYTLADTALFRRTLLASGAVGTVFALQHVRIVEETGRPRPAAAILTAAFGAWYVLAPLQYADAGVAGTAVSQAGGLIVGAFGAYGAIESLAGSPRAATDAEN